MARGQLGTLLLAIQSPGAVAALTGAAVVLGAIVGGAISGGTTYAVDRKRREFERGEHQRAERRDRERELVMVRGAARVWREKFNRSKSTFSVVQKQGKWFADSVQQGSWADTDIPYDDVKLVASFLTAEDWAKVQVAITATELVTLFRQISRDGVAPNDLGPDLSEADVKAIDAALDASKTAMPVLQALGDREPDVPA